MTLHFRTRLATQDNLDDEKYREIYDEIRDFDDSSGQHGVSLRRFVEKIDSQFSHTLWSKYERGLLPLSRAMKSELRVHIGLPPLPMTVDEALGDVDPDAEVLAITDAQPDWVVLTTQDDTRVKDLIRAIASVPEPDEPAPRVTSVTRPTRARKGYTRPCIPKELETRREALGASWSEILEAGFRALEQEKE